MSYLHSLEGSYPLWKHYTWIYSSFVASRVNRTWRCHTGVLDLLWNLSEQSPDSDNISRKCCRHGELTTSWCNAITHDVPLIDSFYIISRWPRNDRVFTSVKSVKHFIYYAEFKEYIRAKISHGNCKISSAKHKAAPQNRQNLYISIVSLWLSLLPWWGTGNLLTRV